MWIVPSFQSYFDNSGLNAIHTTFDFDEGWKTSLKNCEILFDVSVEIDYIVNYC
jgi:hypothetical protein